MIQEKDLDQDGRINFDEFLKIITRDTSSLGLLLILTVIHRSDDGNKASLRVM